MCKFGTCNDARGAIEELSSCLAGPIFSRAVRNKRDLVTDAPLHLCPVVIGVYACFVNFCSCRFVKQLQGTRDLQDLVVVLTVRQLRAVKHVIKTTTSRGHNLAILRPGHPAAPWKTM